MEEKKKVIRKQDESKKENLDETLSDKGSKSEMREEAVEKETEDDKSDKEEKKGVRKSGRITRNKEKQIKEEEEDEKIVGESSKGKERQGKGKAEVKKVGEGKVKDETESDSRQKELSEKDGSKSMIIEEGAEDKPEKSVAKHEGTDRGIKALGRRKEEIKTDISEDEQIVNAKRVRRKRDAGKEEGKESGKTSDTAAKSVTAKRRSDGEGKEKSVESVVENQECFSDKDDEESVVKSKSGKKLAEAESKACVVIQEKAAEDSKRAEGEVNPGDEQHGWEEGNSEDDSPDEHEEYNEDSDYDPEYDPDRLWCVCRKPHGNR